MNRPVLQRGTVLMSAAELDLLARTVADASGDHLEIGAMWGGSAIVAAAAKAAAGRGERVVCIDPFLEADEAGQPTAETFLENIGAAGYGDTVDLLVCRSAPWPMQTTRRFGSVLIDGDHVAPWPETDFESARVVSNLILVHDVNWHAPDVARMHSRIVSEGEWQVRESARFLFVYERAQA